MPVLDYILNIWVITNKEMHSAYDSHQRLVEVVKGKSFSYLVSQWVFDMCPHLKKLTLQPQRVTNFI